MRAPTCDFCPSTQDVAVDVGTGAAQCRECRLGTPSLEDREYEFCSCHRHPATPEEIRIFEGLDVT